MLEVETNCGLFVEFLCHFHKKKAIFLELNGIKGILWKV